MIGRGREEGGLYVLEDASSLACTSVASPHQIHCRLGHPSLRSLQKLDSSFQSLSSLECESCQLGKLHRVSYTPRVIKRSASPFLLVHSDIWGPCRVVSNSGFRYFVTFVDDYSRVTCYI